MGFDAVAKEVGSPALAAYIGRKKYGAKQMASAAKAGKPLSDSDAIARRLRK